MVVDPKAKFLEFQIADGDENVVVRVTRTRSKRRKDAVVGFPFILGHGIQTQRQELHAERFRLRRLARLTRCIVQPNAGRQLQHAAAGRRTQLGLFDKNLITEPPDHRSEAMLGIVGLHECRAFELQANRGAGQHGIAVENILGLVNKLVDCCGERRDDESTPWWRRLTS